MYYHIIIEVYNKANKKKVYSRIDERNKDGIINDILLPYILEEEFLVDGYRLTKKNIERIKVTTTEQSAGDLVSLENKKNLGSGLIFFSSGNMVVTYRRYSTDITNEIIKEAEELIGGNIKTICAPIIEESLANNKVFIVHGQDEAVKQETARFIEKISLEPIILHEQSSSGLTIIEKIEQYSDVGFAVVLYTPCDVGNSKENDNNLNKRARQNVVFEHGYLIGKLGRNRVCALVKGDIEKPNDISGVVYIPFDNNSAWKFSLAKEMKVVGYNIDLNCLAE